jgi:hypothetical protein
MCFLCIKRLRVTGSIGLAMVLYYIFICNFNPGINPLYVSAHTLWFFFLFGVLLVEIMQHGSVKSQFVVPLDVLMILIFIAISKPLWIENHGPVWNSSIAAWERSSTFHYPWYYQIFSKHIMLWSYGAPRGGFNYSLETFPDQDMESGIKDGALTVYNRSILEYFHIPARARDAKITFYTQDNNYWVVLRPRFYIRETMYVILFFLSLYINISFFCQNNFEYFNRIINRIKFINTKYIGIFYHNSWKKNLRLIGKAMCPIRSLLLKYYIHIAVTLLILFALSVFTHEIYKLYNYENMKNQSSVYIVP